MTDFSEMTDDEINERIGKILCNKNKGKLWLLYDGSKRTYVDDDSFCMGLIKDNNLHTQCFAVGHSSQSWVAESPKCVLAKNKSLNRAVLECYLQIKQMKEVLK